MQTGHNPKGASGASTSHGNDLSLLKSRGNINAACTRTETFVNSVHLLTPIVRAQSEERRLHLNAHWDECIGELQSRIGVIDEQEASDRSNFEETFYSLCAKIRHQLQSEDSNLSDHRRRRFWRRIVLSRRRMCV